MSNTSVEDIWIGVLNTEFACENESVHTHTCIYIYIYIYIYISYNINLNWDTCFALKGREL